MTRYVLTGVTGNLGSRILRSVLKRDDIDPSDVIISSSNPRGVPAAARERGVEVRKGNYLDRASMESAFAGADVLFLMSHPDPGTQRVAFHRNAIETARSVGVKTVVYSSMMLGGETGLESDIGIQQGHIGTMRYLAKSGMEHIIVRQGIYAEAWAHYAGHVRWGAGRKLDWSVPLDIAVAWTALDELGEGNAAILANYRDYVGQTLRLTGPKATKISEIARIVEERTGSVVKFHELGTRGEDGWFVPLSRGEGKVVDPLLGKLLGRTPKAIEDLPDRFFRL